MIDAQTPGHASLDTIIRRLREGRYVVPDFQREFEWNPWDVQSLMRSIFLDYYIGSLLLWKGTPKNFDTLACESIYGFEGDQSDATHIVLDGQQRLTAMHYAFLAPDEPLPNRANRAFYYIFVDKFMDGDHDEAFQYDWSTKRFLRLLEDDEAQYREHVFPLRLLGAGIFSLSNWLQGYASYWKSKAGSLREGAANNGESDVDIPRGDESELDRVSVAEHHAENAREFAAHVEKVVSQYQVSYIELDREIGVEKVCDIFTQINSTGVRLDVFDLMNALLKPKGLQLKHMWREAAQRLEFVETSKMNVYVLQVMSILRQAYCSPKYLYFLLPKTEKPIRRADGSRTTDVLIKSEADFEQRWQNAVDALERAIKLLRHPQMFGAVSARFLPYPSILPVFAALQEYARKSPEGIRMVAQRKIRHWYWASVFTNRYSGAVESTSARDFLALRAWIQDDEAKPALIDEFASRFSDLDFSTERRRGTSIYNGVFNLLVLRGARDWANDTIPVPEELDDHHIVPASWGREHLDGDLIHTVLNRTPLSAESNRRIIRDRLPNTYLRDMIDEVGEERADAILASHLISPAARDILLRDPFTQDDFVAFIEERERTIKEAIYGTLIQEKAELSPSLRQLDDDIEAVELRLRALVTSQLDNSLDELPHHVRTKIDDRVASALKKQPGIDGEQYASLSRALEHADLRELQDAITNKALWSRFEPFFRSKQQLAIRFNQLAELRNTIRHSRALTNVTRKEGEAAIDWFSTVLPRTTATE